MVFTNGGLTTLPPERLPSILLLIILLFSSLLAADSEPTASDVILKLLSVRKDERYLWYGPHSGFGNQVIQFRHALRMAGLLNRTLIVPPVLRHFDSYLGRCETGDIRHATGIRKQGWLAMVRLFKSNSYVSMADIIDISSIPSNLVRTIDLRLFAATHCGIDISAAMVGCSWCGSLQSALNRSSPSGIPSSAQGDPFFQCGVLLGSLGRAPSRRRRRPLNVRVNINCTEAVWTYGRNAQGQLANTRSRVPLLGFKCSGSHPFSPMQFEREYFKNGLDVSRAKGLEDPQPHNVVLTLGVKGSAEERSQILTLGSTMHYFDLEAPLGDPRADSISCQTAFLPFVKPIMFGAARFASSTDLMNGSFACLHFRGGDGVFGMESSRKSTISNILLHLLSMRQGPNLRRERLPLFLMSDLRSLKWRKRLAFIFGSSGYDVHFPYELSNIEPTVEQEVRRLRYGLLTNQLTLEEIGIITAQQDPSTVLEAKEFDPKYGSNLQDMGIYLEQAVCSCADDGFIGHPQSTISENIFHLRSGGLCYRARM